MAKIKVQFIGAHSFAIPSAEKGKPGTRIAVPDGHVEEFEEADLKSLKRSKEPGDGGDYCSPPREKPHSKK